MIYLNRWRRLLGTAGFALAALLLAPGSVPAQNGQTPKPPGPKPYEGRDENETIMVDLEKGTFEKTLPFDVTFRLSGPMPERFGERDRLDARFVEFNRPPDCGTFFSQFKVTRERLSDLNVTDSIPVRRRREAVAIESSGFRQATVFDAGGRGVGGVVLGSLVALGGTPPEAEADTGNEEGFSFLVDFPALRPNRYYCFQFISRRALKEDELLELRRDFAAVVDEELRREKYRQAREDAGSERFPVETEDYEKLRLTLSALIESKLTKPNQVVLAPKNSFFDAGARLAQIKASYRKEFEDLANETVGVRLAAIGSFEKEVGLAVEALGKLAQKQVSDADGTSLGTLHQALRAASAEPNAQVNTLLEQVKEATGIDPVELLTLSADQRPARLAGVPEDEPQVPDLRDVWVETEEKAPIKDRIDDLEALSQAVGSLTQLAALAGIRAADLEEVPVGLVPRIPEAQREALRALIRAFPEGNPQREDAEATLQRQEELDRGGQPTGESLVLQITQKLEDAAANLGKLQKTLRQRSEHIAEWVGDLLVEEQQSLVVGATTIADYDTRAIWYMSADIGTGISWDTEDFFTYIGWNIYFRPVNKKAHLSWAGRPFGLREEFLRRFSFTVGLVQDGFEEEDPLYKGVVGTKAAVLGAGFRINDSLRLSVGGLVFENENPDPLISSTTLNWAPYAALSFDWNVTATLAGLFAKK